MDSAHILPHRQSANKSATIQWQQRKLNRMHAEYTDSDEMSRARPSVHEPLRAICVFGVNLRPHLR
jgi:hypothetical protein